MDRWRRASTPLLRQFHSAASTRATSSVSADEVAHFARLASTWWDHRGPFGLLHRMNPSRVDFLRSRIIDDVSTASVVEPAPGPGLLRGKKVLDVGCGGGLFSEVLARLGGEVLGIDAVGENVEVAKLHASQDPGLSSGKGLGYEQVTAEELVGRGSSFDVVCAMEVVEHVEDPKGFLSSLADLTKPGGHLILSTISRTALSHLLTITLAESSLPIPSLLRSVSPFALPSQIGPIVPPGTHHHSKFITPDELKAFFHHELRWSSSGERSEMETRGVAYEPWRGRWRMMPRGARWAELANYYFGAKKPLPS